MITIEYDKKKYKIPNTINEFTIRQYQDVLLVDKKLIRYERFKKILHKISDIPLEAIDKMNATMITNVINGVLVMLNQTDQKLQKAITIDDELYLFEDKIDNIRFEQFIDLVEFTDSEELTSQNLHLIAAILYRKVIDVRKEKFKLKKLLKFQKRNNIYITEEYDSSVIIDRSKIFQKQMTMDIVYGLIFFFMNLKLEYLKRSVDYLMEEEKKLMNTKK